MNFSVPATSANLGPGFDTLGLSLNFRNYFNIVESKETKIHIQGEGQNVAKFLSNNLFVKIFLQTYNSLVNQNLDSNDNKKSHFTFSFYNNIPLSRGLGSSSALIVGAIFSAYKMANITPIKSEVLDLAFQYEHHPDNITPAVHGGFNVSFLRESDDVVHIKHIKKRIPRFLSAVVVIPSKPMHTKLSRNILPKQYAIKDCIFNISHSSALSAAFFSENYEMLRYACLDRIHEVYRMKTMPILFKIQKTAMHHGALMSTLSGSGSSILNLCYKEEAQELKDILESKFPYFRILALDFDNDGVKVEDDNLDLRTQIYGK